MTHSLECRASYRATPLAIILITVIGLTLGAGLAVWIVVRPAPPAVADRRGGRPPVLELRPAERFARSAEAAGPRPDSPSSDSSDSAVSPGGGITPSAEPYTVVFEAVAASGSGGVGNIIVGANYNIEQRAAVSLPYRKETRIAAIGHLYLWVQNAEATGPITCRILVDGKVLREETESAPYGVCQVSGPDSP